MASLRCRLGFHRWQNIKQPPDMEEPWITRCRDCGTDHSMRSLVVFLVFLAAGVVVFWFAPLLGSLIVIGAFGGALVIVTPAVVGRVVTWLSVGR